jgi:transposase
MTIRDVSENLGMSWNTLKEIQKKYLEKQYGKPRLKGVRYIAIDEFAVQKGHKYMTVVYDLEAGRAIYITEGRESEGLNKFWKRIKCSGAEIKAVAMDMWPAYLKSVMDNNIKVKIIFDRFHIISKMNGVLDETRRRLYREETEINKREIVKGTRWLLLKREDNLDEGKEERKRLEEALKVNQPLAEAYYLKEELNLLWNQKDSKEAERFLTGWVARARATGIQPLIKFGNMLLSHRTGIFNWYEHHISTGPLEGFNNKIKVLKRKAYGYRDSYFFKLKIYALHETRYALL